MFKFGAEFWRWILSLALNLKFGAEFWRWIQSLALNSSLALNFKFGAEFQVWRWIRSLPLNSKFGGEFEVWRWIRSLPLNIRKCQATLTQQANDPIKHKCYEKLCISVLVWDKQIWSCVRSIQFLPAFLHKHACQRSVYVQYVWYVQCVRIVQHVRYWISLSLPISFYTNIYSYICTIIHLSFIHEQSCIQTDMIM